MKNIYEVQAANKRKSAIVIVFFVAFVAITVYIIGRAFGIYVGYEPSGIGFVGLALIISGISSFGSYYYSDKIVLGISRAKPASRETDFNFYTAAENLSIGAGLPKPKLYVIEDSAMNAFATGRDPEHAVVCVTRGLLDNLSKTELEGVIAHELTHIKNYDIRLMSVVTVMVGLIALIGDWFLWTSFRSRRGRGSDRAGAIILLLGLLFAILSPVVAKLIQLFISRKREFYADSGSVAITRQPSGLMSALDKIASDHEPLEAANKATAHLYIENPFKDKARTGTSKFSGLFNTHPPIEDRIAALEKMA